MQESKQDAAWEDDVAELLSELSSAQDELLGLLTAKRELLATSDLAGMEAMAPRETDVMQRLERCQERRAELLEKAAAAGLPSQSVRALVGSLPAEHSRDIDGQIQEATGRARLLQHSSLTNWVLVQRSILHLSNLLEIIATGGRLQPTYRRGEGVSDSSGALVDHAA